jgi:thiamine pyrophosphate-dependent acetolactate synthase large subunit-like protein
MADELEIPFITSPMGRGYLPDDHPRCLNDARGLLQQKADVVLLLGARLDWTFRFGTQIARDAKLIQIDIHEPEIGTNRAPTIGIVGDVKLALQKILARLTHKMNAAPKGNLQPWFTELEAERERGQRKRDAHMSCAALPMSPHRMFKEIKEFLQRDAICVLDGNVSMAAGQQVLPAYLPASRFTAGSNGCMGVRFPLQSARNSLSHIGWLSRCGDMGFALSAMDMETAVRHRIPVIVVVVNNEGNTGAIMEKSFFPNCRSGSPCFNPTFTTRTSCAPSAVMPNM